jgi:hypothetical protein
VGVGEGAVGGTPASRHGRAEATAVESVSPAGKKSPVTSAKKGPSVGTATAAARPEHGASTRAPAGQRGGGAGADSPDPASGVVTGADPEGDPSRPGEGAGPEVSLAGASWGTAPVRGTAV